MRAVDLKEILDFDKLISDLKLVESAIEWDYPLEWGVKIEEVIEILRKVE